LFAFAERCGFREGLLLDVESAAGEALANAAEHGDGEARSGFDVSASFDGRQLVIEIKDHGAGFDCVAALANQPPDCSSNRGFGIFLMRRLMDDVIYSEAGSRVQLVKRLAAPAAISFR
jgi:anti-sigma regulatory factor (Ser/Thr protein kinase)